MSSIKNILLLFWMLAFTIKSEVVAQSISNASINIGEDIYFDETEVDVATWLSYYSWTIIHEGQEKAESILPDSNLIEPELWAYIRNTSFLEHIGIDAKYSNQPIGYFRKSCQSYAKFNRRLSSEKRYCAMLNFPITGITYEQAIAFCSWRTKMVEDGKYEYTLPTLKEWRKLAMVGLTKKERQIGMKDSSFKIVSPNYNFNFKSYCPTCIEAGTLFGVAMFLSDEKKFFDVWGNVSEMTSEKGLSKGGNFMLYANQCHPDSIQYYLGAQRWLGFRCVAKKKYTFGVETNLVVEDTSNTFAGKFGILKDGRDNKSYPTVIIGKQIWMAANLAFKPDSGKYWVYDNNESNANKYGYLYTWKTAQNACPVGWNLPSKAEFEELINQISDNSQIAYKSLVVLGNSGLNIGVTGSHVGFNFTPLNSIIIFWTSTENTKRHAWGLIVNGIDKKAYLSNAWNKPNGFPVRCIQVKETQ